MANCETAVNAALKLKIAGACHAIAEARELKMGETLHGDRMRVLIELVSADPDALACLKSLNGKS